MKMKNPLWRGNNAAHMLPVGDNFENIPHLTSNHDCPIVGNERRLNKRTKRDTRHLSCGQTKYKTVRVRSSSKQNAKWRVDRNKWIKWNAACQSCKQKRYATGENRKLRSFHPTYWSLFENSVFEHLNNTMGNEIKRIMRKVDISCVVCFFYKS